MTFIRIYKSLKFQNAIFGSSNLEIIFQFLKSLKNFIRGFTGILLKRRAEIFLTREVGNKKVWNCLAALIIEKLRGTRSISARLSCRWK